MWREDCGEPRWQWGNSGEVTAMVQARDGMVVASPGSAVMGWREVMDSRRFRRSNWQDLVNGWKLGAGEGKGKWEDGVQVSGLGERMDDGAVPRCESRWLGADGDITFSDCTQY